MHEHEYYEDLCSLSLDDELTASERAELTAHLSICPACEAYMEQLRSMKKLLTVDNLIAPSSLHEDIMELVLADAQKTAAPTHVNVKKRFVPVFTMLAAAAAAVMLVTSGTVGDLFSSYSPSAAADESDAGAAPSLAAGAGAATADAATAPFSMEAEKDDIPVAEIKPGPAEAAPQDRPASQEKSNATAGGATAAPKQNADDARAPANDAPPQAAPRAAAQPAAGEAAPAVGGRSVMAAGAPAGLSVVLPETPEAMKDQPVAACYVAVGTGKLPDFGGSLAAENTESKVLYFTIENNISVLEKALAALDGAGYAAVQRSDLKNITIDAKAELTLIVVVEK